MSGISKKLMSAAGAGGAGSLAIEDVFSTYLYVGNQTARTITNGIDLAGEGGLTWITPRTVSAEHQFIDSERGVSPTATPVLISSLSNGQINRSGAVTAYNSDGFDLGTYDATNYSGRDMVSWTFRKAPRFFDVVTYTGTGSARTVSHDLGLVPGCIIVKRTDTTGDWQVYHRSNTAAPETDYLVLNSTAATADSNTRWNDTAPTDSVFTVGTEATVNASGGTYVAYLFAHDPLGPSEDGSDGLIACGGYAGNSSADGPEIDLGWEPQWVMVKSATGVTSSWNMYDTMRGMVNGGVDANLQANTSDAEDTSQNLITPTATGFKIESSDNQINNDNSTYIYIAIRRGPMRVPESGTEVFAVDLGDSSGAPEFTAGFPVDMASRFARGAGSTRFLASRMTGEGFLNTTSTAAEDSSANYRFDYQNAWGNLTADSSQVSWMFRRAPGFFDVVCDTGTGAVKTVNHSLGVVPDLIIRKRRSSPSENWLVYPVILGASELRLNQTNAIGGGSSWNNTLPTEEVFTVGSGGDVNGSTYTYVNYLFATLPGVSKVGSYTGNGTSQTIDCGFTSGARFILIKRTDSTGDWYVWDTARGIVTGNDPHLSLNTTAAEVTTDDTIDPDSSGFIVNQVAATNVNVSSASYIFMAIS